MQPDSRKLLADALEAARAIRDFTSSKTLDDLKFSPILRSAVYWQFAVIGETLSQLRRIDDETLKRITESKRIIAFRNQIVHGYAVVDDEITWNVVKSKLPTLLSEIEQLLA